MTQPASKRLVTEQALAGLFTPGDADPPTPDPLNRIKDPSFNNLGTWVLPAGGARTNDNIVRSDDDNGWYLRILTDESVSLPNQSQTAGEEVFRVWPGDTYSFSALWRRAGAAQTAGNLMFRMSFFDINQVANAGGGYYAETQIPMNTVTGSAWTEFSMDVEIPDGTAYAQVFIGTYVTHAGGYWDFDKIRVYQRPTAKMMASWQVATEDVNLERFDVHPSNSAAVNSANLATALAERPVGRYTFPQVGTYQFSSAFPLGQNGVGSNRHFQGVGYGTTLTCLGGLFKPAAVTGQTWGFENVKLSDLHITNDGSGSKPIMDFSLLTQANHYWINFDCDRVWFDQQENSSILKYVNTSGSASLYGIRVRNSKLTTLLTATAEAAIQVSSNTVGVNDWIFDGCFTHSLLQASVPFIFIAYGGGNVAGMSGLRFANIIAEQPKAGFANLQGCLNPQFENVVIWDTPGNVFTGSGFRFAAGPGGVACFGVAVDNCGCPSANDTFPSPHELVRITGSGTSTSHNTGFNYIGQTKQATVYA